MVDILNLVNISASNSTITEEMLEQIIFYSLDGFLANFTIDIPSVLYTIENAIQIENLRNLTSQIYYTPDGFVLDGILSLGKYSNLMTYDHILYLLSFLRHL